MTIDSARLAAQKDAAVSTLRARLVRFNQEEAPRFRAAHPQTRRVLIVEDDPISARLAAEALSDIPEADIETAGSAEEAYRMVAREAFDLLIVDLALPDESGLELIDKLRRRSMRPLAPVLLMSAADDLDSLARRAGANGCAQKPIDASLLSAQVAALFDEP